MAPSWRREREKVPFALALAWIADSVDAIGSLTLARLFTPHMSGNSARLGVRLGRGELGAALPLAVAVGLLVVGVVAGTTLVELTARQRVESIAAVVLGLQTAYKMIRPLVSASSRAQTVPSVAA